MRKKGRSRIAVLLGIGAICGMLGTTGRYVYAENMTTATAAIEESTGDITPAQGILRLQRDMRCRKMQDRNYIQVMRNLHCRVHQMILHKVEPGRI